MSAKRPNTQLCLAFDPSPAGEARVTGDKGTEARVARGETE
jgi:hypothetical protein